MAGATIPQSSSWILSPGASDNPAAFGRSGDFGFDPLQGRREGFRRVYVSRGGVQHKPVHALVASFRPPPEAVVRVNGLGGLESSQSVAVRAFWSDAFEGYLGEETEVSQDGWSRFVRAVKRIVGGLGKGRSGTFLEQVLLYSVYAAVSVMIQLIGLRYLDPHRIDRKKAAQSKKELAARLNLKRNIETNMYEDIIAGNVINPRNIDVTFSSIGGLEDVKEALHELAILPLQRPELFNGKLLRPQKGVLLYGPPGTGKTLLAKALAKEAEAVFINVQLSSLMSKWLGDAQKLVTALFTLANKLQPAIIFIDEVDSFLGRRGNAGHEVMTQMKTEFMALWDGLTTDQNARILVLAATNRPWDLDEAILRRLPRAFEIGMPDLEQRQSILRVLLEGEMVEDGLDIEYLASLCDGCSGSDMTELCKQAAYLPIRELLSQEKDGLATGKMARPLRQSDLELVLKTARPSKAAATDYYAHLNKVKYAKPEKAPVFATSDLPFACN